MELADQVILVMQNGGGQSVGASERIEGKPSFRNKRAIEDKPELGGASVCILACLIGFMPAISFVCHSSMIDFTFCTCSGSNWRGHV